MNKMKTLVIGAGGIGGIVAANIRREGFNVEVVDCLPGLAKKIQGKGIQVFGKCPEFRVKMKAWSSLNQVKEKKDVIIIATKANVLPQIISTLQPLLKKESIIISLQNGVCEEELSKNFGNHRVIGCVVGWGATVHKPGELEKTSDGDFVIGKISEKQVINYDCVTKLLSATAPVKTSDNIYGVLYSKLIINSCITTLGAICGLPLGKMLAQKKCRKIFIEIIREAVNVGKALGISITKYADKINFNEFTDNNNILANLKRHLIIMAVGFKYKKLKSSSLQSLESGRKTEVDYLNGYIVNKAKELNIDTPINEMLIKIIKEIESGKRTISFENFNAFM